MPCSLRRGCCREKRPAPILAPCYVIHCPRACRCEQSFPRRLQHPVKPFLDAQGLVLLLMSVTGLECRPATCCRLVTQDASTLRAPAPSPAQMLTPDFEATVSRPYSAGTLNDIKRWRACQRLCCQLSRTKPTKPQCLLEPLKSSSSLETRM
jgi:hypothetical protein